MRHVNLDMIRVTEAAALAASTWVGSGNKEEADRAATEAIRDRLNRIDFNASVAIGEGKKDKSHGLFAGEKVGRGLPSYSDGPYELAIDPIEGTTPTVTSGPEAISTIAIANEGCMHRTEYFYMNKLAYGKNVADYTYLDITWPIERIVTQASQATGKTLSQLMVCILDRPRHDSIVQRLRALGVRIKLIRDCDVSGAVAACLPKSGVDLLYGIGGAPEAVISAAAIKCLGGGFQVQAVTQSSDPSGFSPVGNVLKISDLVKGDCAFVATGITDGSILRGVRYEELVPVTNSVFMRSESGTIRWIRTEHGN